MKKLSKLLAIMAGLTTLFFAGCSDVSEDAVGTVSATISDRTAPDKEYNVQFFAEDGRALDLTKWGVETNETASSRTIVADGLGTDLNDPSKVVFYLWGSNQLSATDDTIKNPKAVTFTLDSSDTTNSTGTVTLGLSASKWNLTLAAVNKSKLTGEASIENVKAAAYYIGYANVDLRSADSIKFYLSADGLSGNGSVVLKFWYDGLDTANPAGTWSAAHVALASNTSKYTISARVTSRLTAIDTSTDNSQNLAATSFFGTTEPEDTDKKTWSLKPGTYNLEVLFSSAAANGDLAKQYIWSDILIVLPNQTITKTVKVPDVVLYKPSAPATFKVGYIEPTTVQTNSYNALLSWANTSDNEKYFEIQIANLAKTTAKLSTPPTDDPATTDTNEADVAWSTLTTGTDIVTLKEDFYGNTSDGWVAGSLVKNNIGAVIKLSLGVRYLMRIAAVNDAGHSDWTYATYDLTEAATLYNGSTSTSYTPKAYTIKEVDSTTNDYKDVASTYAICANLYRLTYHLNKGIYKFTSADASKDSTADLVYYLSQKPEPASTADIAYDIDTSGTTPSYTPGADGINILFPYADTAAYPQLVKGGKNRWTSWRKGSVEGKIYQNSTTTSDPVLSTVSNFSYYAPDNYLGFENLDLFASYTVATAAVDIYVDENYDFLDSEITLANATSGANHAYKFKYTNATTIGTGTTLTLQYAKADAHKTDFTYDSLKASIKRMAGNETVAVGVFDSSTKAYAFDISPFGDGVFYITVVGEYKGHQYSYGITLTITDETTSVTNP